jgi:sulfur relay (sulfurtransferase) DsrF/TusC family protein
MPKTMHHATKALPAAPATAPARGQATTAAIAGSSLRRRWLWLLHYTQGLVLLKPGQDPERVDLPELENMRDLLLDPATGDVWVAGWTQLVRLRPDASKQRFRVK